jgi:antirestriction protein
LENLQHCGPIRSVRAASDIALWQIFDAIYGSHLMPSWSIDDLRHWRDRAEEARLVAADMKDPDSKEAMLRIAKHYERLADRAQRLGRGLAQS